MRILLRSSVLLLLLLMTVSLFSQNKEGSSIICGKILFQQDSVYPLKPYAFVIQKEWPISFKQFEQVKIDTTDYSFKFKMDLDQLTYGNINVIFFKDIDSTTIEINHSRIGSELSDGVFGSPYAARILFSGLRFVIEPGDSLHIVIDYDKLDQHGRAFVSYSGIGGANNNFERSSDQLWSSSKNFRLPLEEGLSNEDLLMESELKSINEAKDSLSQAYFHLLKNDAMFNNLGMKHKLIRASLNSSDITIEAKRELALKHYTFLDTLTLRPGHLNSTEFRHFLDFYLEYLNRIITGDDVPFGYNEKSYWLAKAVFSKELLKAFLYERLAYEMETPLFYSNEAFQYKDFINRFPDTPESHRLTEIYTRHFPVSNGQLAPDLELIDSIGRTTRLSRLKGKVVIISPHYSRLETIAKEYSRFGKNKLILVALHTRHQKGKQIFSPSVNYYVKEDQNSQNYDSYRFTPYGVYNFIIRKNGCIEKCAFNLKSTNETITKLLSEKYTVLTRLNYAAKSHITVLVVFLSVLLSVMLVLLFASKLKQKRQDLIKKQLNSELKAIRSQLNPHFLFNSLNSIQNFINKSDSKSANLHLSKFSLLMRKVIELSEKESTTLKEELDFNKTFIELEQLRYGFKCKFDIDHTIDLYNTEIPGLIIQPFVENAIVHCMADLGEKGELNLIVRETGKNEILVEITDNGKGFLTNTNKGFGLKSSRERIDLLNSQNKDKIELHIESAAEMQSKKGTTIRLIIPKKY